MSAEITLAALMLLILADRWLGIADAVGIGFGLNQRQRAAVGHTVQWLAAVGAGGAVMFLILQGAV